VISLALTEHVWMLLVGCLSRRHPLQRSAFVGRRNSELNLNSLTLGHS
jgi:hypothetical protein